MPCRIEAHLPDATNIFRALQTANPIPDGLRALRHLPGLKPYQRFLLDRFGDVIGLPSCDYISKAADSWLIVGDHRRALEAAIQLICDRHGVGVGMLVLHLQQLAAGHIPLRARFDGADRDLIQPTEAWCGARAEHVLWIPVRALRGDVSRLAALGILKPEALWDPDRIVSHEHDGSPCFFCSCGEMNPAEVVVELDARRFGLSRSYCLGFTFAPFGNPLAAVHFLAWDRSPRPLSMSLAPGTVSDLVQLSRLVNDSIKMFFAGTGLEDFPVIDGLSNGWAGNTIFHAHFQFFAPEFASPLDDPRYVRHSVRFQGDDASFARLDWPLPAYCITAVDPLNTALLGQELAALWRFLGGDRKGPYKLFPPGFVPTPEEFIPAHTQNLYVPGRQRGRVLYLVLRDREKVDFLPGLEAWVNPAAGLRAQPKKNLGVLEATGTWIVDDAASFSGMKSWSVADVSEQIRQMTAAIAPPAADVKAFEHAAGAGNGPGASIPNPAGGGPRLCA